MTPQRVLTVCLGVSTYPPALLEHGEKPLRYLADSANDLHTLFGRLWPEKGALHRVLVDAAATKAGLDEVLSSADGEHDLFILYLGGHGRVEGGTTFQFLFHGERPKLALAQPDAIDTLVGRVRSSNVLLLLDACSAGAYGRETSFFRSIGQAGSRLCIASSRADQKSWEDAYFRRSLFADAIANALTSGGGRAKDVASELYSNIAAEVARHAFALKASVAQEPVLIGGTGAPLFLPTATPPARTTRSMTTYQVLVRRTRQIAVGVAAIGFFGAILTSYATWRPALNNSGNVELRPGPKWLSALNFGPWRMRVETDIVESDLKDEDRRAELLDESGFLPWPGLKSANVRRWADVFVESYLNTEVAARWRIRLGYTDAVDRLTTTTRRIIPFQTAAVAAATELAAEAKLLQPSATLGEVWRLQWRDKVAAGSCVDGPLSQEQSDQLSFYLRLSEPADYASWLRGLALAARADDAVGFEEVAKLVEMFTAANHAWRREYLATVATPDEPITAARIAERFTERPTRSEVVALASIAVAIIARRLDRSAEQPGNGRSR